MCRWGADGDGCAFRGLRVAALVVVPSHEILLRSRLGLMEGDPGGQALEEKP